MSHDPSIVMGLDEKAPLIGSSDSGGTRPYHSVEGGPKDIDPDGPLFQDGEKVDAALVTASVSSSLVNLTNTIVGAGVLALPFAFKSTGAILGIVVLVMVYLLILMSIEFLVAATRHTTQKSYAGVAIAALGYRGNVITQIATILTTFGAMTSYLIIIGDMTAPLIGLALGGDNDAYCSLYAERQFPIACSLPILIPLCMLRNIDSLRYTSAVAVFSVLYLVLIVVYKSGESIAANAEESKMQPHDFFNFSAMIFRAIPIITLAFTCHMNVLPVVTGLKHPTKRRVRQVTIGSITICVILYALIGLFGFLTFYTRDAVEGNVLLNYDVDEPEIIVGRVAVTLVVVFSFPILAHPCIGAVEALFFNDWAFSYKRRAIEVACIVGPAFTIAFFVADVSIVLGVAGSTGSTLIGFILPGLFYMVLNPEEKVGRVIAALLMILGVVFLCVSTWVTLQDAFDGLEEEEKQSAANLCNATLRNEQHPP
eukprot:m.107828 g.107828  ORF g.107828 m.107828 type:complete len:482 (-) comp10635_c0_seq4:78-1523(-)